MRKCVGKKTTSPDITIYCYKYFKVFRQCFSVLYIFTDLQWSFTFDCYWRVFHSVYGLSCRKSTIVCTKSQFLCILNSWGSVSFSLECCQPNGNSADFWCTELRFGQFWGKKYIFTISLFTTELPFGRFVKTNPMVIQWYT